MSQKARIPVLKAMHPSPGAQRRWGKYVETSSAFALDSVWVAPEVHTNIDIEMPSSTHSGSHLQPRDLLTLVNLFLSKCY